MKDVSESKFKSLIKKIENTGLAKNICYPRALLKDLSYSIDNLHEDEKTFIIVAIEVGLSLWSEVIFRLYTHICTLQ